MKELIKQIRLAVMVWIIYLALFVCPKDCISTLYWFKDMPLEK